MTCLLQTWWPNFHIQPIFTFKTSSHNNEKQMWSICPKKRIHPITNGGINNNNNNKDSRSRKYVRKNGWSTPLHPLQITAWIFILFFSLTYFIFMIPFLPTRETIWISGLVNAVVFSFHIVIHILSVTKDPADDSVILKFKSSTKGLRQANSFDKTRHEHVIENQFCYICEVSVGPKSKHCSVCNKCVSDFDHHCKWLNNCVGSKNYR